MTRDDRARYIAANRRHGAPIDRVGEARLMQLFLHQCWLNSEGRYGRRLILDRRNLYNAHLDGADFSRAILRDVSFAGSSLRGARFLGTEFERVSFWGCELHEADFTGAHIIAVSFELADLTGARLNTPPPAAPTLDR